MALIRIVIVLMVFASCLLGQDGELVKSGQAGVVTDSMITGPIDQAKLDANVVMDDEANSYSAGLKQTFVNSASTAGFNITPSALPSSPANGDIAILSTGNFDLNFRANGVWRVPVTITTTQTLTGIKTFTNTGTLAGLNLAPSAAPSAPANGGLWALSSSPFNLQHRANGATRFVPSLAAGTSGGVLYFSAANTASSSAALTLNRIMLGGGAGAAPTVLGSLGTTNTLLHGNAAGAPSFSQVVPADTSNPLRDKLCIWNLANPVTGDDGDYKCAFPAACTMQELYCHVTGGTSATVNLYERVRSTPNTGTTNMVTTSAICTTTGDTETAFDDSAFADNALLALGISAVSGSPTAVYVEATCRLD